MAISRAGMNDPCVNAEQFEAMKRRFRDVGDCLTDQQLLELADSYHEILRWRREVRLRHATAAMNARVCVEPRSFADPDVIARPTWDEAFRVIMGGAGASPPAAE